jgi:CO dehydrogenase/acetyl-CoA synthase delta subunit
MEEPHLDFEEIYYGLDEPKPKIISPTILYDINDVLFIEILEPSEEKTQDILCTVNEWKEITIDLTSVKKKESPFFLIV